MYINKRKILSNMTNTTFRRLFKENTLKCLAQNPKPSKLKNKNRMYSTIYKKMKNL